MKTCPQEYAPDRAAPSGRFPRFFPQWDSLRIYLYHGVAATAQEEDLGEVKA